VPVGGAPSVDGELVLGIGSRTNNVPPESLTAFQLDGSGLLKTTISGASPPPAPSFLDTGSNGIFFTPTTADLATCPSPDDAWFCPASPVTVSATTSSAQGSPSAAVTFQIESIRSLAPSVGVGHVGGPAVGPSSVDFGLPFFFGRDVYVVIEGRPSRFGVGPLLAY
jgi:hypothetical protein